jgi:hypothetical protein
VRIKGMLLFDWYLRVSSFLRMDVSLAIVSSSASPVVNVPCPVTPLIQPSGHTFCWSDHRDKRHIQSIIVVVSACLTQKAAITSSDLSKIPESN